MTDALRHWDPALDRRPRPILAVHEPRHGPIWVATLPNWRKRIVISSATAFAAAVAIPCLLRPRSNL